MVLDGFQFKPPQKPSQGRGSSCIWRFWVTGEENEPRNLQMELGVCLPEDKALQISKAVIKSQMKVEWAARGSRLFLLASPLCQ